MDTVIFLDGLMAERAEKEAQAGKILLSVPELSEEDFLEIRCKRLRVMRPWIRMLEGAGNC